MAKSFLTDIQLNRNVLLNAKIQAWGSAPTGIGSPDGSGNALAGQISSYLGDLYIFTGASGTPANTWSRVGNTLSDSTSTTSSTTGASSTAVKAAYDLAAAALPKSGGTMTGTLAMGSNNITGTGSISATTFTGALTGNASTATTAGKWTSAVNLAGNSVDGSTAVAFANKFIVQGTTDAGLSGAQFLGALGTGIVKNTTTTGVLSIASAGDFPTLNQNTTGSAGSVANTLTFGTGLTAGGASFNGSAAVTITPVSATTSVAGIAQLSDSTSTTSSVLAATATAAKAAYDRGSTGVTNAATAQSTADAALPKAGGTMSGAIAMGNNKITGLGTPTDAGDAATKSYVDNVSTGVNIHDAVVAATTGTIAGVYAAGSTTANPPGDGGTGVGATITYSATGVVTLDTSVTLAQGDRVLVKDGTTALSGASSVANGIYVVTTAGAVGTAAILTRSTDADNSHFGDLSAGDLVYVIGGNTYAGDQFVQTTKGTATSGTGADLTYSVKIGTDAISYTQFSGAGAVPAATTTTLGIASFTNTQFDVASGAVSIKSAAALPSPVLTTPTLNGTITLGSTPSFSGAVSFANTLTATGGITMGNVLATGANNITQTTGYLQTADIRWTTNNTAITLWDTTLTIGSISTGGALTTGSLNLGNGTAWTTGTINIGNGASGSPTIRVGAGNGTAGTATIAIGNNGQSGTGKSTTTIAGIVKLPQVTTGTAGFVKVATDGTLSTDTTTYGTGTVTGVSVASANGFAGSSSGGATPALTLSTSITGVLKGNGTAISAATAGTDYIAPYGSTTANTFLAAPNGSAGTPSFRTVVYADLPTNVGVVARKVSLVGTGSGTTIALTHGLGTNLVTAQVYDTSTSTATLVETDITVTSTVATATFAATTTLSNYTLVVVG